MPPSPTASFAGSTSRAMRNVGACRRAVVNARGLATLRNTTERGSGPTGIVLMNMGGPSTLEETGSFLSNLFHDRDIIQIPLQSQLAPLIAKRRTPKIREQYDKIGGGSPILRWTRTQGAAMAKLLDELHPSTAPHLPYVMFRYAEPLTAPTLDEMEKDGVKRAVAFSQYPQYSCSTTGSSLNELYRLLKKRDPNQERIKWSVIDRWPTHPGLVEAVAQRVRQALSRYDPNQRSAVPILFSAHSLPMSFVSGRGDPYPAEVAATVHAVMTALGFSNPWRLTWQSQVGPSSWLGPQTSDAVMGLAKQGFKDVVVVPIAFTSDHIETLYELDIELKEEADKHGIHLNRAESLNDSPLFIRALADIAAEHLSALTSSSASSNSLRTQTTAGEDGSLNGFKPALWNTGLPTSRQMALRCPNCPNALCGEQKRFFGAVL